MNNAIYRYELRQRWTSVAIWVGSLASLVLIFMALFPSFSADIGLWNRYLKTFHLN